MGDRDWLYGLSVHPERMNGETLYQLRTIVARYPYFQTARMLLLFNLYLLHDSDFGKELKRSVFFLSDRRTLWQFVNGADESAPVTPSLQKPAEDKPSEPSVSHTMHLIDAFLETMPEQPQTLRLDSPASTDYLASLGWTSPDEEELPIIVPPSGEDSADDNAQRSTSNVQISSPDEEFESGLHPEFLTETLARIYIKQKKYDRALAIIRSLYLNYPEKSIYFADQIRFLEKLVRINQTKKVK